jgi:hypothetical protein
MTQRLGGWLGAHVGSALALVLGLSVLLGAALPAFAEAGDYRVSEGGQVYLGNARLFSRPCVVSADTVYKQIPEYREICEKGLTDKDARYHFLMKKASEKFLEAVRQMAKEFDFDLVAEVGAVKTTRREAAAPPDRTADVTSRLR